MSILTICTSKKSSTGLMGRPSAARSILEIVEEGLRQAKLEPTRVDFSTIELPLFEGVPLSLYDQPNVVTLNQAIEESRAIVLSAPAYWGGPSGLAKNFIDLLGGAAYDDQAKAHQALAGKIISLIVIGASDGDAGRGAEQLQYALERLGARLAKSRLCLDNPRKHDPKNIAIAALSLARSFAKEHADV